MSRGTNDLGRLASLLVADPLDALKALGGPWYEDAEFARDLPWRRVSALSEDDAVLEDNAHQFLGRVGPSVVLCIDRPRRRLVVGIAVGHWASPGTLVREATGPASTMDIPVNPARRRNRSSSAGPRKAQVDELATETITTLIACIQELRANPVRD